MELQQIKENNRRLLSMMSVYLNCFSDAVDGADVREIVQSCYVPAEDAYAQLLAAVCGVDSTGADKAFFREWILPALRCEDSSGFCADAYYRTVHFPEVKQGEWELTHGSYAPYELFVCGDLRTCPGGKILPQLAFFEEGFSYPMVKQNEVEWMSVIPNEIVTMRPAIQRASGKVLTFGLGLGYFAFHAAEKPEVESVTVVERDETVIALFREYILPQIPGREKIRVIASDAFVYAKERMGAELYDYVYTDIWHDPSDGAALYLRMKKHEVYAPTARFDYWCEDTIKHYI